MTWFRIPTIDLNNPLNPSYWSSKLTYLKGTSLYIPWDWYGLVGGCHGSDSVLRLSHEKRATESCSYCRSQNCHSQEKSSKSNPLLSSKWRFPKKWGCTSSSHPFSIGIFHEINHPAIGIPSHGLASTSRLRTFRSPSAHLLSWYSMGWFEVKSTGNRGFSH